MNGFLDDLMEAMKKICDELRKVERWIAQHDRLFRQSRKMRVVTIKTHSGYGKADFHKARPPLSREADRQPKRAKARRREPPHPA